MDREGPIGPVWRDASAFESFFRENYHLACLIAYRYLKDEQMAEDVVQETFFTLWEKRFRLSIERDLKQYLLFSVRNRCLNHLQRSRTFSLLDDAQLPGDLEDTTEEESREELAVQIAMAIEELPAQCKKVFLLAYQNQLTYNQIAATLNVSKNTVKTQMGIAYRMLREKLSHYMLSLFFFCRQTIRS
ncbi:MAG: RNA polymerase sigma-70 factor [Mangrovibacterium sp.]